MNQLSLDFSTLYSRFSSPLATVDCGERCAPYNERGVPFCCDKHHAVPTAYQSEWEYLNTSTSMWRLWQTEDAKLAAALHKQLPDGQMLIDCLGHTRCQRDFRAITCRAFPFFPYLNRQGEFLGLAYYWEYEDRCWIISNLDAVTQEYRAEFDAAFDALFEAFPDEREGFRQYSSSMRRVFGRQHRAIPLLHRNGGIYKVTPRNGRLRCISVDKLSKFAPYHLASDLPFPNEIIKP